jgi:N-acetylglutamate synthase-like GNAT family acetyltransferase
MGSAAKHGSKINIREITDEDIEAVLAIDKKIVGDQRALTYKDPIDSYLGGEYSVSFVAEVNGKIVGFALARLRDTDTGWLQAVGIDPEYRHQRIGAKLVEAVAARCRSRGAKTLHTVARWRDWWMLSFLSSLEFSRGEMVDLQRTL